MGPSTLPCGTPHKIFLNLESVLAILTHPINASYFLDVI